MKLLRDPIRLVPSLFALAILVGTVLLSLPFATAEGTRAPLLTALFTTTSAIAVTGLVVVDTGTYWSPFGQVVILLMFQIGGLGIMTAATLLGLLAGRGFGLHDRLATQVERGRLERGDALSVLKLVLGVTLTVEAVIAAILAVRMEYAYGMGPGAAIWNGVFHAVSAFNNAGFSTHADSVMGYQSDPLILIPIMTAITLGVVLGFAAILAMEWSNAATLGPMALGDKLLNAAFHSVMPRTAGFNSLDVGAFRESTLMVNYLLMFIGGGSAGTAGGIKVTTFVVLFAILLAEVQGRRDVGLFGRRFGHEVERQALTVTVLSAALVFSATTYIVSITALPLGEVLFECISAFATVGMSTGITADLPPSAQVVIVLLMFIGRVGTITFATALAIGSTPQLYRYPKENLIVG